MRKYSELKLCCIVNIVQIKAEELEELCDKYQVEAVPTVLFFKVVLTFALFLLYISSGILLSFC